MAMGGDGPAGLGRLLFPGACLLLTLVFLGYAISSGRRATHVAAQSVPVMAAPDAAPPAPSIPARLALSNENGLIAYSGTVGDDATRAAIIGSLTTVFGADKITGDLTIDSRAGPAAWTNGLKAALNNFKTRGSQALFEGNAVSAGGAIPGADRDRIISAVKSALGPQFAVAALTVRGSAKTAPPALGSGHGGKAGVGPPKESAIELPVIYFAANSAEVPSRGKALLRQVAGPMKQLPAGTVVRISGYTHDAGNPTAYKKLSQRRADAVRQILVHEGINPAKLIANGYGSSRPPAPASEPRTMEGRSSGTEEDRRGDDRRVEFSIVQQ